MLKNYQLVRTDTDINCYCNIYISYKCYVHGNQYLAVQTKVIPGVSHQNNWYQALLLIFIPVICALFYIVWTNGWKLHEERKK